MLESLDTTIDIWYRRYYHHKYSVSMIHCNCVSILQYMGIYASKRLHEQMLHVVFTASHDVHCLLQKHFMCAFTCINFQCLTSYPTTSGYPMELRSVI